MREIDFPRLELPISIEQFYRLPQDSAYKYEYFGERVVLTPRPKSLNAVLDLREIPTDARCQVRTLPRDEIASLGQLCRAAFRRVQPLAALDDEKSLKVSRSWMETTLRGEHGPLIEPACFVAHTDHFTDPIGAIIVTLAAPEAATDPWGGRWHSPPPTDAVERRLGVPHLCWVFVSPWESRHGVGTALLNASCQALLAFGFTQLASTFLQGNDSSTLWHWRNGFRLIPWSEHRKRLR